MLGKTLVIVSVTPAALFLVLMIISREDILMPMGAVLFLLIFIGLGLWAAHDSPRFKRRGAKDGNDGVLRVALRQPSSLSNFCF